MKFVRFRVKGSASPRWGTVEDGSEFIREIEGSPNAFRRESERRAPWADVELLPPAEPSKIICIGLNYAAHAAESNKPLPDEPLVFLKPPSSLIPDGATIRIPYPQHRTDHEAELGVVIGERCSNLSIENWQKSVLGYTCANDVTDRDLQRKDGQFTRGKGFDTFCPLGPVLATGIDPSDLQVECEVNGEKRQASRTSDLIFPVAELVVFISKIMTLEPGDMILTGTPSGVGPLSDGDVVKVSIEGLGTLTNTVGIGA